MKNILTLVFIFCLTAPSQASTSITSSSISGHWTLSGSPYLLFNNVTIDSNHTLVIDPGVEVILQGNYSIKVKGILHADGSPSQYISFYRNDTTGWSDSAISPGGWGGLLIDGAYSGLDSVTFNYCKVSDMKSGDILNLDRSMGIRHSIFSHNKIGVLDVSATNKKVEISGCKFQGNSNYIMNFWLGQGVFYNDTIYNNIGIRMIAVFYADVNFYQNLVYNNQPNDSNNDGALVLFYSKAKITDNQIYGNTLGQDGAIASWGSQVSINRNYLCNNRVLKGFTGGTACGAVEGGGAIRLDNSGDTVYQLNTVCNNIIANNYAGLAGSAVYILGSNVKIYNNDIINNSGGTIPDGAPISITDNSTVGGTYVSIKNNIFYNNIAVDGGISFQDTLNVSILWADTFEFNHNYIERPLSSDPYFDYTAIIHLGDTSNNIIDTAQQLLSPTLTCTYTESALLADFRLKIASKCIDKGDTAGCFTSTTDYWHNRRLSGSKIDIGAYEFQYPTTGVAPVNQVGLPMIVYPNPVKEIVQIQTPGNSGVITIRDLMGKTINRLDVLDYLTTLDIRNFIKGVYFLTWSSKGGTLSTERLIVE